MTRVPTNNRRMAVAFVFASALLAVSGAAPAQTYPSKPVRVIVPIGAGSTLDVRARVIANALTKRLKQQVIVDNRPGAGGTMGTAIAAQTPPDGLTLLFNNNSHVINPHIYRKPGYAINDFIPVSRAYVAAMLMVIDPNLKVASVKELIAQAKADPDKFTYASSGNGGIPHLCGEIFKQMAGVEMLHIPFKSDAQALNDVLGGRVSLIISGVSAAVPHVKANKLRALAVTTRQRIKALPEVPTMIEAGVPGYEVVPWTGFFAPARTPKAIIDKLNAEIRQALEAPEVKANFEATGAEAAPNSSEEFTAYVKKEYQSFGKLVKEIGLTVD